MQHSMQDLSRPWLGGTAIATLSLGVALALLHAGDAGASLQSLPPNLARALATQPREARAQLPDGTWLVLERDGSALRLVEDRVDGRTLRRWPLATPRRYASLSLLPSGRVLLWGGVDANNRLHGGGLWFDPATRALTSAYQVPLAPRAGHAASVLSDGRLLVTGGWTPADAGAASELWDERSDHAATGAPAPARLNHRSRVEADGRVRLSDGIDAQGRARSRDQFYDPAQRSFADAPAPATAASAAAPRLSESQPRDRQRDVAANARLALRFSEPLRAGELNAANVTLLGPRGLAAVQVTPAEAGRLLFVTPRQRLQANADYSLLIDGVHARNGQPLAPTLIDFATAAADAERAAGPRGATSVSAPAASLVRKAAAAPAVAASAGAARSAATQSAANAAPPVSATLTAEAAPLTVTTTLADQAAKLNFSVGGSNPAPQDFGVGISDLVVNGSSEPAIATYTLPGQAPASVACAPANGGCDIDFSGVARGSYSVTLQPPAGATLGFKASLSRDRAYSVQYPSTTSIAVVRRGQNARLSFDASAGAVLGLRVSQTTAPSGRAVNYSLIAPNGSVLQQKTVVGTGLARQVLPATGRYAVLVDPAQGETATAQVTVGPSNMVEADGDPLVRADVAGVQPITFESDGQKELSLGLSGLSLASGTQLNLSLNSFSTSCVIAYGSCRLSLGKPPAGVYAAAVGPAGGGNAAFGYSAFLSAPKPVQLQFAQTVPVAIERAGQPLRLQFDLAAGQDAQLNLSEASGAPAQATFAYTLVSPLGATLASRNGRGPQRFDLVDPVAGRYTLLVDATRGETWSAQASLDDPYAATPIGAGDYELRTQAAGEQATLRFANPTAADIGVGISGIALTGASGPIAFALKNAQGAQVAALQCAPAAGSDACELDLPALARGQYDLEAKPPAAATSMRATLTFSQDLAARLSPPQPLDLQIPRRGQNARVRVAAQAGATLNLSVDSQLTAPAGQLVAYTVRAPDGSVLAQNSVGANGSGGLSLRDLPSDGDYEVFVDPAQAAAVSAQLSIIDDFSADLVANADPVQVSTRLSGQVARLNFQAAPGARLGIGIDRIESASIPLSLWARVRNAAGAVVASTSCDSLYAACALDLDGIDAGSYSLELEPAPSQPGYAARVTLSSDQEHTLVAAQPLALDIQRWGQNARLWFQGEAGQHMSLAISGHSHQGLPPGPLSAPRFAYTVYAADGSEVRKIESEGDAYLQFGPLASTGTYSLRIDPLRGDAMSAQVRLDPNPDFGLLAVDGAALRMSTQYPGQKLRFAFDVAAADSALSLDVAAVAPVAGAGFELRVTRAGMPSIEIECGVDALGCTLPLNGLAPGRYEAAVSSTDPASPQQFAIDATLSARRDGELSLQQPYPLQLRSGQPAHLRVAGSAGQRLRLSASAQATTPADANVAYVLRAPDGAALDAFQSADAAFVRPLPALPADGDYRVEVTAAPGVAVQTQLRLDPAP
ncbi:Ig-like domain-containing protein [Lysobacter enzymogenes]|nr:Ig-like domain-containing protein [Lysobacter enzymogenes]